MNNASAYSLFYRLSGGLVCLALLCLPHLPVQAANSPAIIPVTTTIQAAITAASEGDTVSIPTGTYSETLIVNKSLTLTAAPGASVTITPNGNNRIITVTSGKNLTLINLSLTGGFPTGAGSNDGGAVLIQNGTLTIDHCTLSNNKGNYGGAIRQSGSGQVIIQNFSYIINNQASFDGGGVNADGNVTLSDFYLNNNQAGRHGGGLSTTGSLVTASRGEIDSNIAEENGGGVNMSQSALITGVVFRNNLAFANGGGLLVSNNGDEVTVNIQSSSFVHNGAVETGGAVSIYQGATTTIQNSTFQHNRVDTGSAIDPKGGAVYFVDASRKHNLTIQNSIFEFNSLACDFCLFPKGGGVYAETYLTGSVLLSWSRFSANVGWMGGGLYAERAVIDHTTFTGNTGGWGGGAFLTGESNITQSAFTQNSVVNFGGGLMVGDTLEKMTIADTLFSGNQGYDQGGAIASGAADITLTNVAVTDTLVTQGEAVSFTSPNVKLQAVHLTVNDTHLANGERTGTIGVYLNNTDTCSFMNSMITNHGTGIKLNTGNACALDHTLWYGNAVDIDAPALTYTNNSPVYADPFYDVDGYHLRESSGAINQGVDRMVYHDLDGQVRDSLPDIGADEFCPLYFLPVIRR